MFKEFYSLLEKFLCTYLPKQKGCSKHTILSYYTAVNQYVEWLSETVGVKKEQIQIFDFKKESILSWLAYIEENGSGVTTRNQRLAGIRSFLSFAADEETVYMDTFISVKKIHTKKGDKPSKDFLSLEEFQEILKAIPDKSKVSVRHYVLLSTLYDSAARVEEICNMCPEDISYGENCSIKIYGKGRKTRIVYISSNAADLIKDYCTKFNLTNSALFLNRYGSPLTDSGVDYIIKKYVTIARQKMPSLKNKRVSAHTFRRSKATHMLLSGVSLPVIQRFLGHESIQTTEEYLEIGSESMIQAVDKTATSILSDVEMSESFKWDDDDILSRIRRKISAI